MEEKEKEIVLYEKYLDAIDYLYNLHEEGYKPTNKIKETDAKRMCNLLKKLL